MVRLADRLAELDREVKRFGQQTEKELRFSQLRAGIRSRSGLLDGSVRSRLRRSSGDLEGLSFSFERHGIFVEHGVGRGRPIGSANVTPRPWLEPVIRKAVGTLADRLAEGWADIVAAEIAINIPGVITTKIR